MPVASALGFVDHAPRSASARTACGASAPQVVVVAPQERRVCACLIALVAGTTLATLVWFVVTFDAYQT